MKSYTRALCFFLVVTGFFAQVNCKKSTMVADSEMPEREEELQGFIHPGVVNNQANLNNIALGNVGNEVSYNNLKNFINSNPVPSTYPSVVYVKASSSTPTEVQLRKNADLVYAYALKWVKTGASSDAQQAIKILNGWSENFTKFDVVEGTLEVQIQLEAAWVLPTFAAAAEIIRHHKVNGTTGSGWMASDIDQFSKFLNKLKEPVNLLIEDVDAGKRQNNWGTSAGYAKMAVGIFNDNKADYKDGKRIIMKLIPVVIEPSGEVYELCSRDCHHPQYSMTGLTYAAEIARIQGDESIYLTNSKRIKTGWEGLQQAFAGNVSCRDCKTKNVYPGIELAATYYTESVGTKVLAQLQRPYNVTTDHTFLGFTTFFTFK